jgi:glycosyltransferase involved in cell wall biosynthesis
MEEKQAEAPQLLVSVLIVSRNSIQALRRCVAALEAAADRASLEILVVDNGSTDGCQAIDSEFPEVTVLRLPHHFGLTKARNIGIRTAKAEYLLLLSPDVEMASGSVSKLVEGLQQEKSALAVCPLLVDAQGNTVSKVRPLPAPDEVRRYWRDPSGLPAHTPVTGTEPVEVGLHDGKALLIRRQTIQGINYLDEHYGDSWIDAELAYQIRRAGRKILLIPTIQAKLLPVEDLSAELPSRVRAAVDADRAVGASSYIRKNAGWFAGFVFQAGLALSTLASVLTLTDLGYRTALLSRLISGAKIDGTDLQL